MIDRKTALICAALIALMVAAALWRITSPQEWPPHATLPPLLMLSVFPATCALATGRLYWRSLRASADDPRFEPWFRWGKRLSISFCAGFSLLQGFLVVQSLGFHLPFAIGRTLTALMMIVSLLAIDQMPKLPWFEQSPSGELGPIYGPRFMRIRSRVALVFAIAVSGFVFAAPGPLAARSAPYILAATALLALWRVAWEIRLRRKWRHEQVAHG